jgi:2-oxoglutarate dehydrogenase E2 component (dihydrolipoamide succinyltransferase)
MPQMGESIAEGTIVRWIKKVGDSVDRDEPLFEISTDKVDAEIPSPASGVIAEIRAKEGETVPVNSVVAVIGTAAEAKPATPSMAAATAKEPPKAEAQADGSPSSTSAASGPSAVAAPASAFAAAAPVAVTADTPAVSPAAASTDDVLRQRSSPLVRKIAKEHNVDITQIPGTGMAGRVTKDDILAFVGQQGQEGRSGQAGKDAKAAPAPVPQNPASTPGAGDVVRGAGAAADEIVKMTPMRKKIAEHMVMSRRTSAHVHSVFEINFTRIDEIRRARKAEFERAGAKLTYMSFITKAVVDGLREVPIVNASVDGESVVYHKDVNVGIAVALDWGLIVPVIKRADEKNLVGLSRAIIDLAGRARTKQLKPDEVSGGTFTITNPGVFGALLGTPIINQPQVAILGVGTVDKTPVVIEDAIAIRSICHISLSFDHRLIDGALADQFMTKLKQVLENWSEEVL